MICKHIFIYRDLKVGFLRYGAAQEEEVIENSYKKNADVIPR